MARSTPVIYLQGYTIGLYRPTAAGSRRLGAQPVIRYGRPGSTGGRDVEVSHVFDRSVLALRQDNLEGMRGAR